MRCNGLLRLQRVHIVRHMLIWCVKLAIISLVRVTGAAAGKSEAGLVELEVIFPPARHVFQDIDEVQVALLFNVESPEVQLWDRKREGRDCKREIMG